MTVIVDSSAVIAYLTGEEGADMLEAQLLDESNHCLIHAVNLCEVYYTFLVRAGERGADNIVAELLRAGIAVREDLDGQFWRQVGHYKAALGIPLGDCFCTALGTRVDGTVVTADHNNFDDVAARGICKVVFIR